MTKHHDPSQTPATGEESHIVAFLRRNPDFFDEHSDLLEELKLTHGAGRAVSLIERQVGVLRDKNHLLRKQLSDLIAVARENDKLHATLHDLTLQLMQARTMSEVVTAVQTYLLEQFPGELSSMILLTPPIPPETLELPSAGNIQLLSGHDPELNHFAVLFENNRPICGRMKSAQLNLLFGKAADTVLSAALIPLRIDSRETAAPAGIIAVGSRDTQRFHASMGTVFVHYMGQLVSRAMQRCLSNW